MPNKISDYDSQTVFKATQSTDWDAPEVPDAKASAVANLKEIGKNFKDAVDPTNHFRSTWNQSSGNYIAAGLLAGVKVLMLPWDLAAEVIDVVALPFKVAKNATDAVYWGVRAGAQAVKGAPLNPPSQS